jgi:two-component system sensor histidine kinase KdpD
MDESETAAHRRAKLKIFFGMAPGVGKTYTMLKVARELREEGVEIVIGALEAHGRPETTALAEGFETLPKKTLPYRGLFVEEFDLHAALSRRPQLFLMDDLAHTNVHGSLHQKRWQDIWDLLDAGIDVYTTVNVQHLESLKDVVAQITGLIVQESVPDSILHRADEIEIVDIPPDEVIQRLKEGKVFISEQARHATDRFFRKGNLLALRELALRKVAEHVDADMRRYMNKQGISKTWAASERLMVCISPREESSRLIRSTKRMADSLDAPWIAVYVENASGLRHSQADRIRLEEHLRLAERLGGETVVMQGGVHIAQDVINLAISRNVSKILIGKPRKPRWLEFFVGSLLAELVRRSGDMDVLVLTGDVEASEKKPQAVRTPKPRLAMMRPILWAAVAVAVATAAGILISRRLELSEVVMVYLLAILVVGLRFGRLASLGASILSVIALDLLFIPPALSLAVDDFKHLGTFAVMLIVGYFIGSLAERVHAQTRLARSREQRILALFRLTGELARGSGSAEMVESAIRSVVKQFQSKVVILLSDESGRLRGTKDNAVDNLSAEELGVAQWAFDHQEPAGLGTDILPGAQSIYLPLVSTKGVLGVLGVCPEGVSRWMEPDLKHLLEAFANQTALALERALLTKTSEATRKSREVEQGCDALLTSVAGHLQQPLEAMARSASALMEEESPAARRLAESIHEDVHHLQRLLSNLLGINHLESGTLELRKLPVSVSSLVTGAVGRMAPHLGDREVRVELPPNLPMVQADTPLLEQVLVNLLENAHAFSPAGQPIEVKGWATERALTLAVADHGPGFLEGQDNQVFKRPALASSAHSDQRAGLGLALCKGVVEAHGGWIQAGNRPSGGAQVLLSLPLEHAAAVSQIEDPVRR